MIFTELNNTNIQPINIYANPHNDRMLSITHFIVASNVNKTMTVEYLNGDLIATLTLVANTTKNYEDVVNAVNSMIVNKGLDIVVRTSTPLAANEYVNILYEVVSIETPLPS